MINYNTSQKNNEYDKYNNNLDFDFGDQTKLIDDINDPGFVFS